MKFNFFQKQINTLGLDISGSSVKMLQLVRASQRVVIKGFVDAPLQKGVMLDDAVADSDTLASLIKRSLEKPEFGHFDTRHVVASLPESKSFVRVIHIPEMSEAEIENAIFFEAENYIPVPIDQVYLDWQPIHKKAGKIKILIVASPKEHVDKYISAIEKADMKLVALEVESQSLVRALIEPASTETTLIVDIDGFRSNLIMVETGALQFSSSIPIAGNTFTEAIASALGVSSQKAESIKKQIGINNTPEYPNLKTTLLPVLNNLSGEIKNILSFHEEHFSSKLNRILLCGGGAKLANLDEFLAPEFSTTADLKVSVANPWSNIKNIDSGPLSSLDALGFATAIGLASRNL